jgi:DNA-binding SARP family transcriptional activator
VGASTPSRAGDGGGRVWFSLLGPLEVVGDHGPAALGSRRQRALLAMLLLDANHVVGPDRLIDGLWGDAPPPKALASVQSYVSNLRRILEPDRPPRTPARLLLSRGTGYAISVARDQLDVAVVEDLLDTAASAETPDAALAAYDRALAVWRGPPLEEFTEPFAVGARARLEERRGAAEEDRVEVLLTLGRLDGAIADLELLVEQAPLRERRRRQLVLALARAGRQVDALASHRRYVRWLADEFGLDPSPAFVQLHDAVLRHELSDPAPRPAAGGTTRGEAPAPPADPPTTPLPAADLLGRSAELDRLHVIVTDALAGRGRLVLLSGEPGIGKSRLLGSTLAAARTAGCLVALGRCYEGGAAPAFWPFVELVRSLASDDDAEIAAGAAVLLGTLAGDGSRPQGALSDILEPTARFLVADAISAFVRTAARRRPLVLGLDDLYGADPDSLEVLVRLAPELPTLPVVLVGTLRTADLPEDHPLTAALGELGRQTDVDRLALRPLDLDATTALLARESGGVPDETTAATVHRRTGGNPFFTVELARLLGAGSGDPTLDVPAGVRDVLRLRLGRLPEATRDVLRVAAVCGRSFPLDLVAAARRTSMGATLDDLEHALRAQLVDEDPATPGGYRFSHVLVQEALLGTMTALRRAHLSASLAELLSVRADEHPARWIEVAHHATEAIPVTGPLAAVEPLSRAAVHAVGINAHELAQQLVLRRLDVIAALPAGPDRDRLELAAQADRCAVLPITTGWHALELQDASRRVQELGSAIGDLDAVTRGLSAASAHATVRGDYAESERIFARQSALAVRTGDPAHAFLAAHGMAMVHLFHGELEDAARVYGTADELIAVVDPADAGAFRIPPDRMVAVAHHASLWALVLWLQGDQEASDAQLARAHEVALRVGHLQTIWTVWLSHLLRDAMAGDAAAVLDGDARRRAEAPTLRSPLVDGLIRLPVAWATARSGTASDVHVLADAIAHLTQEGALVFGGLARGLLADTWLQHGHPERALETVDDGLAFMARTGELMWHAELLRLRAEAFRRLGRRRAASDAVAAAATSARAQGAVALTRRIAATAPSEVPAPSK